MKNTDINRQIVREGLNRRAATAKEREAALEAVGREFRAGINQHSQSVRDNIKAAQEAQERKKAQEAAAARRRERKARREAQEVNTWYAIYSITLGPLLLAAASIALCNAGIIPFWLMAVIAILACMYSVAALIVNLWTHCNFPGIRSTMARIRKAFSRACDVIEKFLASLTVPMMSEFDTEE